MKPNKFALMPDLKLINTEKTLKPVVYMLIAAIIVLFINSVYNVVTKDFSALNAIPLLFLPIVTLNYDNLREVQKEMKARGLK